MSIPGASSAGESGSDSSDCSISSHASSSDSETESSSDWDVTSSDNDSSDDTTLDIYSHSRMISTSYNNNSEFDVNNYYHFDSGIEGEISYQNSSESLINHTSNDKNNKTNERVPYLLKMTTSHYNEPKIETEAIFDLQIDLAYYLYSLFYPYTNYQSLLFSQAYLYEKIKKQKRFKIYHENENDNDNDDDDNINDNDSNNINMDWNNIKHIERISGLLSRLLSTAGPKGIEEISIYQMFSQPSPNRIIYELRFGLYSNLCITHLDRFGRRTFYYYSMSGTDKQSDQNYFFHDDLLTQSDLFNEIDVDGLSDFIRDEKRKSLQQNEILNLSSSQTQTIKDDKNVANIMNNKNIKPTPIETTESITNISKTANQNQKKIIKKKKAVRVNSRKRASTTHSHTNNTKIHSVSANSSPRQMTVGKYGGISSPITPNAPLTKRRLIKKTITTITTTTRIRSRSKGSKYKRSNSITNTTNTTNIANKKEEKEKEQETEKDVSFNNFTITSLFRRRLSARNEKLIKGLSKINRDRNIRYTPTQTQTQIQQTYPKKKRRRKITIEEMGNGKWCTIQLNHQFLVSGFIRNIAKLLAIYLTVPLSIVKLVGMFYYYSSHLLLISGSMECKNTKHNQLHILGISNKKRYKIKLNRLKKPKKQNDVHNNNNSEQKQDDHDQNDNNNKELKHRKIKYKIKKKKKDNKNVHNNNSLTVNKKKMQSIRQRKSSTPTPRAHKISNKKSKKKLNHKNKSNKKIIIKKKSMRTMSLKFDNRNNNNNNNNNTVKKKKSNKIKRSTKDVSLTQTFDRYGLGNCFTTQLSLPKWPWLYNKFVECDIPIHHKGKYCVILRSGGTYTCNETVSKENDIIIFNSKHLYHTHSNKNKKKMVVELDAIDSPINMPKKRKTKTRKHKRKRKRNKYKATDHLHILKYAKPKIINGYYARLAPFKKEIEYLSVIYNEYHSKLFSFGGLNLGRCVKSILELKLNCESQREIKWRKASSLKRGRYQCSLLNCGYYSNRICAIGGLNNSGREMRTVELYNICSKETQLIAQMNEGRSNCGSCYICDMNNGTIVCGGGVKYGDGSKQIELFNFDKNIWTIHSAKTNYKHSFPTIWNDQINPNIIYIGGDNIGISGGGRNANLGFIEWCDLRECNKKQFNVLYEDSIDRLWRFKLLSRHHHNAWESRALFCM